MNILITGANRGIGYAITKKLLSRGHRVIGLSRTIHNLLEIQSVDLIVYEVDLLDINQINKVLEDLNERKIVVNVIINNAGKGLFKGIESISLEEWENIMRLNVTVPFYLIHKLIGGMKANSFGRIINIGSDADHVPYENASLYCATKFGLFGMTESLRLELKKANIGITTISPARVDTYFNDKKPGDRPISLKAEDVANQVCFILEQDERCNIEQIKISSILE